MLFQAKECTTDSKILPGKISSAVKFPELKVAEVVDCIQIQFVCVCVCVRGVNAKSHVSCNHVKFYWPVSDSQHYVCA